MKNTSDRIINKFPEQSEKSEQTKNTLNRVIGEISDREGSPEALKSLKEILDGISNIIDLGPNGDNDPLKKVSLEGLKTLSVIAKGLGAHDGRPAQLKDTIQNFGEKLLAEIKGSES